MTNHIRRRDFVIFLGGATAAWPMAVSAQQSRAVKRLAILVDGRADSGDSVAAFPWLRSLERFGWFEGRNLQSTTHFGNGRADCIQAIATELVRMNPDLILVSGATGVVALLRETQSIPILFVFPGDPVAIGLVASMARPGGNATGFTGFETGTMVAKGLQLIKEFAPAITRLLVLHGGNPSSPVALTALEKVVGTFGVEMTDGGAAPCLLLARRSSVSVHQSRPSTHLACISSFPARLPGRTRGRPVSRA